MKNILLDKVNFDNPYLKLAILLLAIVTLILISNHVFAADLLAGTDADMKDTMKGTGKHWLYYLDGGASLFLFFQRKNPTIFFSVLGIAIFINALILLAGG